MEVTEALDFLCDEARSQGADHFDALAGESDSIGLELFESKVKNTEISASRGIGIRLFSGDCPGYAFTEKFSKEAITQTVRDAMAHTQLTDPLKVDLPEGQTLPAIDLATWNNDLQKVQLKDMKELGLALEDRSLSADKRVENVPHLGVGRTSDVSWLKNSRGAMYSVKANSVYAGLGVLASQGKSRKMGVYSNSSRNFLDFHPEKMAGLAVERAVELLGAKPISSGRYPVVLSNRVSPQIFSMYSSPFFAEVVHKGQSKLEGKINTSIAAPCLTLVCDPLIPGLPGSRMFDGEGVLTSRFEVISKGVLMSYLYNLESAKREGRLSTGHASRGYSGQVGTGFSNLMVAKGTSSLEELLQVYPKCLYVTNLEGSSGCSAVSGEISIGVQGFWVEGGEKKQPVEGVTISSNYFDLLKSVEAFSHTYSDTFSYVKVPDVLVHSMFVAG